ncbi:MAG TPA: M15 family metallopeptidase [Acidimicrobiia bacterium]|nr:M15 family metallopeptidase [Acidimicrobiia bacterium]
MRRLAVLILGALLLLPSVGVRPAIADYEITAESPGCGYPRFYLPESGRSGSLPDSFPIRGPAGGLFGRTLSAVRGQLVWWTVPMSDGVRVQVHRRLLPVLEDVARNLAEAAARGNFYEALDGQTFGFNARTSVAHGAISYHGMGAAIDVNSVTNPYRRDGRLITDMPDWYVDAWEEAGMCWGGSWNRVKDPMHFSWTGPGSSPSYAALPAPVPPLTSGSSFDDRAGRHEVIFGRNDNPQMVIDASGDGAPDVAHVRPWGDDAVLELATSRRGWEACSVWRWWLEDPPAGHPVMADVAGVGRPDLVFVDDTQSKLVLRRYSVVRDYERTADISTAVPSSGRHVFGDVDRDGADDLWSLTGTGDGVEVQIWSAASSYQEKVASGVVSRLSLSDSTRLGVADRDVDGKDDLLLISPAGDSATIRSVSGADLEEIVGEITGPPVDPHDEIGFEDYDGDGRPDMQVFSEESGLEVFLGNTPLNGLTATSWFLPDDFECPDDTIPYFHDGPFADDEDSIFEIDIEWLAGSGITRGCNPPFEDRFCPEAEVSRGQMAAFLTRALGLAAAPNAFGDDDGSVFEADIAALAAAGITKGCNPPANDDFCPDEPVTRGQMAAFLTRALGLAAAPNAFGDDDGSVFERDIAALAAAGITRGCNPPDNDRFCPDDAVTRAQMAAFLHRAGAMLPDS